MMAKPLKRYTTRLRASLTLKIQNIKQKVVKEINPVGHSFDALAKIKEATDKYNPYLLWKVGWKHNNYYCIKNEQRKTRDSCTNENGEPTLVRGGELLR